MGGPKTTGSAEPNTPPRPFMLQPNTPAFDCGVPGVSSARICCGGLEFVWHAANIDAHDAHARVAEPHHAGRVWDNPIH